MHATHLAVSRVTFSTLTEAIIMELCFPPHLAAVIWREIARVMEISALFRVRLCSSDIFSNSCCFVGRWRTGAAGAGAGTGAGRGNGAL